MIARKILMVVLPLVVIGAGVGASVTVFRAAPEAAEPQQTERVIAVEVDEIHSKSASSIVSATGLVQPAKQLVVMPEVTGRIVRRAETLVPGGRIAAGEVIARLDGRQFRHQLRQEASRIRSAELNVQTEKARQRIAEQEWSVYGDNRPREKASLALRLPHLDTAHSSLDAAHSGADMARLNVSKTVLRAPFNAVVMDATAEVGQLVSPASQMAVLVGTDELWVRVSVPVARLEEIAIPGVNATNEQASKARVVHVLGQGREVTRQGRVVRLEGQLDPETRTGRVLVAVQNPLDEPEGEIPLLPGAYVRVEIEGRSFENVFEIPRQAIAQGNQLWIVTDENRLDSRTVEILWGDRQRAFVRSERLTSGQKIVVSPMSQPLPGVLVELTSPDADSQ